MSFTKKQSVSKDLSKKKTKKHIHTQTHKMQHKTVNNTFNDICDLYEEGHEPLNDETHIFSASFFKLNDMYRDITEYINGLLKLINYLDKLITKHNQNIHFFLYYDNSIEHDAKFIEIKQYLLSKSFVKLIKYFCSEFMLGDMHKGVFGTLVRMFPLFDKKYEKNIKSVIDIDFNNFSARKYDTLFFPKNQFLMNKNDVIIGVPIGYEWQYFNLVKPKYLDGFVLGNITFNKISLDSNLLRDMLFKINKGDKKIINTFNKIIEKKRMKNKKWHGFENTNAKINPNNLFIYGIDEYFLNSIILDYCIEHNKKIGILYGLDGALNTYLTNVTDWFNQDTNITKQFFREFLKEEYDYKNSINQCLKKGSKLLFYLNVKNKKQYDILMNNLERLYNLIQKYSHKINFDIDYIKNIKKTIDNRNYLFMYGDKFNTGKIKDYRPQIQNLQ
jgi:hypothetical protein